MNVKELIEELNKYDPDKQVVIRGYEDGFNDILQIREMGIIPHPYQKEFHYGEYDEACEEKDKAVSTPAIELLGSNTKSENL